MINGNGITNNCTDAQRASNACHVRPKGRPSQYGGNNNAESSGSLKYVVVKHTGFEVAPGDELNGVTFNAVGSGTTVENLEVYSTYDDGVEFFGGAVNVTNLVAMYVRDDSIDFSDGYVGTVKNALVIHPPQNSNNCIEGDNIASSRISGASGCQHGADHEPDDQPHDLHHVELRCRHARAVARRDHPVRRARDHHGQHHRAGARHYREDNSADLERLLGARQRIDARHDQCRGRPASTTINRTRDQLPDADGRPILTNGDTSNAMDH